VIQRTRRGKTDDQRQVATRVSPETWDTLQIGMLVEKLSMQDLLRPVIETYARELAEQPEVIAIAEQVEAYQAKTTGVEPLKKQRRRRSRAS
jgi:hypothetical protein